jgi:hypothetical protein
MRQSASDSQHNLAQKIEKWKAGLADLGRRNPLIKFRQDSPRILEILKEEPDVIFKNLTEEKKSLHFLMIDDVNFLEENEPILKQKYHPELFSSELPALAKRYQQYNRFWLIRIFNRRYRRDIKLLKKLSIKEGQVSHNELKRDLAQAIEVQARRNEPYQSFKALLDDESTFGYSIYKYKCDSF